MAEGLVERLREAAQDIRNDGTPSQVGLTDEECEQIASALEALEARALAADKAIEALRQLMDCSRAIVGANTSDDDASEAFDMYFDAQTRARSTLNEIAP